MRERKPTHTFYMMVIHRPILWRKKVMFHSIDEVNNYFSVNGAPDNYVLYFYEVSVKGST